MKYISWFVEIDNCVSGRRMLEYVPINSEMKTDFAIPIHVSPEVAPKAVHVDSGPKIS